MTIGPVADRPLFPEGYIQGETALLPWTWAEERLAKAGNYWFCTTRPDGRPHVVPAWAVWMDGAIYFDGSPETRRARNLARNPAITVHLENGSEAVIVDGDSEPVGKPDPQWAGRLADAFAAKYEAAFGYRPDPKQWDEGGLWRVRPRTVLGWSDFAKDPTRWRFGSAL